MFLTLGLLVFPVAALASVAVKGTVLALVLVFVARPVAVAIATLPFAYSWRERVILGWAGLRGAVPVVLATFPVIDARAAQPRVLQHRVLRRAGLDARAGLDLRGARTPSAADDAASRRCRGRSPSPERSGGWAPRCSSIRSPPSDAIVGARVRDLGLPRDARRQRHRPRRQGDPAARLDPAARRRRAAPADQRGVRRTCVRGPAIDRWRTGPIGPPPRPPRPLTGRRPIFTVWSWNEDRDGDASRPRAIAGQPRDRAAADPPRPARRSVGARRRPLRDHRPARRGRIAPRSRRLGAAHGCAAHPPTNGRGYRT